MIHITPKLYVLLPLLALLCTQNTHAQQSPPRTTLTITDSQNGRATIIDTTFVGDDIDAVLRKMGYDEASLNKTKQPNVKRTINIDVKQEATQTRTNTITTAKPDEMTDQKILQITKSAPNATIETLPDGSKKITSTTNKNGTVQIEEKIIKINTKSTPEYTPLDKKAKTEIQIQPPTFTQPSTPKNEKQYIFEEKTTDLQHPQPTVNITIASPDMFDASTINQKDPDLLNAKTLEIKDFMISPNYEQGYYSFKFKLPQPPANTWMRIYDIVGTEIYAEYFQNASGNFEQMLPDFNLYKKGTFLVLITQENKKYLQKIILE